LTLYHIYFLIDKSFLGRLLNLTLSLFRLVSRRSFLRLSFLRILRCDTRLLGSLLLISPLSRLLICPLGTLLGSLSGFMLILLGAFLHGGCALAYIGWGCLTFLESIFPLNFVCMCQQILSVLALQHILLDKLGKFQIHCSHRRLCLN